ncbi:RNA chaperone Hfq [Lysinibacillus sp. FSL H8-0500]|uniref:RNA-binding protein Hfq n=1 Tax=Lysinibacillus macroides TaxID=33935 RepID=A0A0N0CW73_9BACI|nr:RNA chaperone Hfq [Lysinibacillus macroides]KOY82775.1 RNA chaperone Hfq [Lysinibacillus macroides]QPR66179.1 RNA chaperone Hfq [Lysinibacillus macroides]
MKSVNLQDAFLNQLRKNNIFVTVFLLNGFQLKGTVKSYDNFTVLLMDAEQKQHLIYKHAISTFVPAKQVEVLETEG